VVSEVINEEHVPEHSAIIAGAAQLIEYGPNRSSLQEWGYFPKH
jgi:hypothetical protein